MERAMSGLKGMLEQITAFNDTVQAAAVAKAAADEQARVADLVAQAREMATVAAMVETGYLVAAADGSVSSEEADKIARAIQTITGEGLDEDFCKSLVDAARERSASEGADARIRDMGVVLADADMRRAAMLFACGVAWLNRGVGEKEGLVLQALARAFGMSIHDMQKLLGQAKQGIS
jgi:hypothetical protein